MKPSPRTLAAIALAVSLGTVAPPEAHALLAYTHASVTVTSTTDGVPQDLPTELYKPDGEGPFPAIVIMHDCSGLGPRSSGSPARWAQFLATQGYVVALPDSFTPRGYASGVCTAPSGNSTPKVNPQPRAYDAFATLAYLHRQAFVDSAHVGVMGGSHGGATTLTVDSMPAPVVTVQSAQNRLGGFAAAIALYPGCGARYGNWSVTRESGDHGKIANYVGTYQPVAPLLILVGEKDDWTPADQCRALAERAQAAGYPVSIKTYPGANHAFDGPSPERYIADRRNANSSTGRGATTGGDLPAWDDAKREVTAFFARYLRN
ncbi:MAG TPA: dienelactone hydrolase family protein [Stellaceae bacterium]|jgi:dienelactone hydrolase|nr:dienelactone hydrolase family protein [Stellaceae bacterium]